MHSDGFTISAFVLWFLFSGPIGIGLRKSALEISATLKLTTLFCFLDWLAPALVKREEKADAEMLVDFSLIDFD